MPKKYADLSAERKKAIGRAANEWSKKNRVTLVSNVHPETRDNFNEVHEKLKENGRVSSKEDTVVYLCNFWRENEKLSD